MKVYKYLVASLLMFLPAVSINAQGWKNPTSFNGQSGSGMADPFVFKYRGTYYMYVTGDASQVLCWHSRDLANWTGPVTCCSDPVAKFAYAPEVKYFNGKFYMVTSPAGNGHYILTSDSPTGPFVCATKNLGNSIDGNMLIDDDGKWYFYHAGSNGIIACPMTDPLTIGAEKNVVPAMGGQWTEGPEVFKRNDKYYMFYCGNHYLSRGYRTNIAVSKTGPISGFMNQDEQNPILISTDGVDNLYGLGHGSVVVGPDFDTYFFCYHNLISSGSGSYRQFCMDRIGWNGDKLMMYGPTTWRQDAPVVAENDYFDRTELGTQWVTTAGQWSIENRDYLAQTDATAQSYAVMKSSETSNFTAEYTVRLTGTGGAYGAVYAYSDSHNYSTAMINPSAQTIELARTTNGVTTLMGSYAINGVFDAKCWHSIRLEKRDTSLKVFVDNMLCGTVTDAAATSGYVGYATHGTTAQFGYIAHSPYVDGSALTATYLPVPCRLAANHTVDTDASTADITLSYGVAHALKMNAGNHATYNINARAKTVYNMGLRYRSSADAKVRVLVNNAVVIDEVTLPATKSVWNVLTLKDISLAGGHSVMRIEVIEGSIDLYEIDARTGSTITDVMTDNFDTTISKDWKHKQGTWTVEDGWLKSPSFGKILMGSTSALGMTDYVVECDMKFGSDVNAGILFRVTNPSMGGAGNDAQLGTDFLQGYFFGLTSSSVVLGKQNYNWKQLVSKNVSFYTNQVYHVKVEVVGNTIKCYVDNMNKPLITYTDAQPFISGRAGLRTHSCVARFDNFVLTPLTGTTSGIKGVSLSSTPVSNAHCGIYTLSGQKVAQDMNNVETLPKGVYIVATKDGSRKIMK